MKHIQLALWGAIALGGCRSQSAPIQSVPPAPKKSVQRVSPITRANFQSLEQAQQGGVIGVRFQLLVQGQTVQLHPGDRPEKVPTLRAGLSRKEFDSLIKALSEANFTRIAGRYEGQASDTIHETLTLSLRQAGQKNRVYEVEFDDSFRGIRPKGLDALSGLLRILHIRHFPKAQKGLF